MRQDYLSNIEHYTCAFVTPSVCAFVFVNPFPPKSAPDLPVQAPGGWGGEEGLSGIGRDEGEDLLRGQGLRNLSHAEERLYAP